MTYLDIYTPATDSDHALRKQATVAVAKAAYDVSNEDPATENHAARLTWARKVLSSVGGPGSEAEVMIWRILENATIQTNPTTAVDSDVQFVVNSLVNTFANR